IALNEYSVQYNTSSDYRLKENITYIDSALEKLKKLKPSRFNWKGGPSDYLVDGFIAHELAEVVPEAVSGEKDAVDENNEPLYQGVDQSKIVPLLTAALQKAVEKIEQLETRIQTLENN
ncbi:MAG: tail fiber domain-containing protein, partial [Cyanophyceae cyanobacterium]